MAQPSIAQTEDQLGFYWRTPAGVPISLPELMLLDDEPERLPPTHLSALDDALIDAAGRFGELLGGGRAVSTLAESQDLRQLQRALDRLCYEYAAALPLAGLPVEARGGQIIGTAQLIAIRSRMALGGSGPSPFAGQLDDPSVGVVAGRGNFCPVDPAAPWRGGRWLVESEDGRRFPLTLSMLLFDSSGVNKDAAVTEHRAALEAITTAADQKRGDGDPMVLAGAIEWLLYDWLMAHRSSPDSGAIEIGKDSVADAEMIVAAAAAGVRVRAETDLSLLDVPTGRG